MAVSALQPIMSLNEPTTLHPFFIKPPSSLLSLVTDHLERDSNHVTEDKTDDQGDESIKSQSCDDQTVENSSCPSATIGEPVLKKRRGRPPKKDSNHCVSRTKIELSDEHTATEITTSTAHIESQDYLRDSLHVDPNSRSSKRRKIHSDEAERGEGGLRQTILPLATSEEQLSNPTIRQEKPNETSDKSAKEVPKDEQKDDQVVDLENTSGPKILRLNKKGTLSSPRETTSNAAITESSPSKPRSRKMRGVKGKAVTVICYGVANPHQRQRIGQEINRLTDLHVKTEQPAKDSFTLPQTNCLKPTHPFFLYKPQPANHGSLVQDSKSSKHFQDIDGDVGIQKKSFTTPVKPRYTHAQEQEHRDFGGSNSAASSFLPQTKARGPPSSPWPWKGFNSLSAAGFPSVAFANALGPKLKLNRRRKKAKAQGAVVDDVTTLLVPQDTSCAQEEEALVLADVAYEEDNGTLDRLIETEGSLKEKVIKLVHKNSSDQRQSFNSTGSHHRASQFDHPACQETFDRIGTVLSVFDRGDCESRPWTQIYAPRKASSVLQSLAETRVLRHWLSELTIDAVQSSLQQKSHSGSSSPQRIKMPSRPEDTKRKRRRKKRAEELDGFVVSDGEDDDEMQNLQDDEIAGTLNAHIKGSDSVIRSGDIAADSSSPRRVMNTILLSGPHGCGKTAAAYAVANELGFSVFEINPSSKRSGKDILDRVGDMSLNHQVKKAETRPNEAIYELPQEPEEGQNTLTSFFSGESKKDVSKKKQRTIKQEERQTNKPTKQQKQSLILLEEVDVLFEDDKQFWETVTSLAKQSRRPIIMTCNNEKTLPLETLSLHAVLRFKPPSVDLAASYLCLVAAAECHLINPYHAVSLYRSKGCDLRASLTELNFWCQMTVGSSKGGLDWYLKRWPMGCDLDSSGQQLHVVSNETYHEGLHEVAYSTESRRSVNIMMDAWSDWDVHPGTFAQSSLIEALDADTNSLDYIGQIESYERLQFYSSAYDSLSAADTFAAVDHPANTAINSPNILDASTPPLTDRARQDYTQESHFLSTEPLPDFSHLSAEIYTSICHSIYELSYQVPSRMDDVSVSLSDDLHAMQTRPDDMPESQPDLTPLYPLISTLMADAVIATELAPYARSIIAYDLALESQRAVLASVHRDGRATKKARTTRASRSALEGGVRASTRRERWFGSEVGYGDVLHTGGEWPRMERELVRRRQQVGDEDPEG